MAFRVGERVICVDGSPIMTGPLPPVKEGQIYTISQICVGNYIGTRLIEPDAVGVCLAEVNHQPYPTGGTFSYNSSRFRPLVSTNIDVFKAILANPHKQLETVE